MKKLILAMATLLSVATYANTQDAQEKVRRTLWKNSSFDRKGTGNIDIFLSCETGTGGNIILEGCSDQHYKCDKIAHLIAALNKISTPEESIDTKLCALQDIIALSHYTYYNN